MTCEARGPSPGADSCSHRPLHPPGAQTQVQLEEVCHVMWEYT